MKSSVQSNSLLAGPDALAACRAFILQARASAQAEGSAADCAGRGLRNAAAPLDRGRLWSALVCTILTTQQPTTELSLFPSLPQSPEITRSWVAAQGGRLEERLALFCRSRGVRYGTQKARFIAGAWTTLETAGAWPILEAAISILLAGEPSLLRERAAANAIEGLLDGVGAKQARAFLRSLGLLTHGSVIDTRLLNALASFGIQALPTPAALERRAVYQRVEDFIESLCRSLSELDILPCELDALVTQAMPRNPSFSF